MISFQILYCKDDEHQVIDCINTLPKGCEIVLTKCVKNYKDIDNINMFLPIRNEGHIKEFEYLYKDNLDLSEARNLSIQQCTNEWIFTLDPDERLCLHQHKQILELIKEFPANIGGCRVNIYSFMPALLEGVNPENPYSLSRVVRLYRKNPLFKFEGNWHELIEFSITDNKYQVCDTGILIDHYGYACSSEDLKQKALRNINKMVLSDDFTRTGRIDHLIATLQGYKDFLQVK